MRALDTRVDSARPLAIGGGGLEREVRAYGEADRGPRDDLEVAASYHRPRLTPPRGAQKAAGPLDEDESQNGYEQELAELAALGAAADIPGEGLGDEAPGGDNPTPDQDIVDDIGRAVGVEYQDNEELKGADKVAKRDKNRWELDPASSDDWEDR